MMASTQARCFKHVLRGELGCWSSLRSRNAVREVVARSEVGEGTAYTSKPSDHVAYVYW